jgi:hypothetical protein
MKSGSTCVHCSFPRIFLVAGLIEHSALSDTLITRTAKVLILRYHMSLTCQELEASYEELALLGRESTDGHSLLTANDCK